MDSTTAREVPRRKAGPVLPSPRGPLSEHLLRRLTRSPGRLGPMPHVEDDPLAGDDLHLALYACYELHYRGFLGVDPGWEWEPSLLRFRGRLESAFERAVIADVPAPDPAGRGRIEVRLREVVRRGEGPPFSRYLESEATLGQFREFVVHRSAYQLKEADPHSWAIPRLEDRAKAALVEIQADEYGGGVPERMHAALFRDTMEALGLDAAYGAHLDLIPGPTLATVNLVSMFGLHRRWRAAAAGHLAAFEMTSSEPNRRYGNALRRLGFDARATRFYDEHVEADSVHEAIAAHDLAGAIADEDPDLAGDVLFGAAACMRLEARFARFVLDAWSRGATSLRSRPASCAPCGPA